jgi:hypothetical protein
MERIAILATATVIAVLITAAGIGAITGVSRAEFIADMTAGISN